MINSLYIQKHVTIAQKRLMGVIGHKHHSSKFETHPARLSNISGDRHKSVRWNEQAQAAMAVQIGERAIYVCDPKRGQEWTQ
jgi:hypothetical protein